MDSSYLCFYSEDPKFLKLKFLFIYNGSLNSEPEDEYLFWFLDERYKHFLDLLLDNEAFTSLKNNS